jgi:formiminotetrahydrofolate cyclodeaminase
MHDRSATIDAFLIATASKQPTPGGGAVAALAGALAAAIGEMVLAYSVAKKDLADHQPALVEIAARLAEHRNHLLSLVVADQAAFAELTAAKKLPADDPDRTARIKAAVQGCIDCPVAIGMTALKILVLADRVTPIANKWLLSDLAVCAELAMATVRTAGYNVRANLSSLDTDADRAQTVELIDGMTRGGLGYVQKIIPAIWARVESN